MQRKDLPTKWWYRLLQVAYGAVCLVVLGTLTFLAYTDRPRMERDYEKSTIVCEATGEKFQLSAFTAYLYSSNDAKARSFCFVETGNGEYRLEIARALSQPWNQYLMIWAFVFLMASIVLLGVRQAALYILAGRS
jgi:hypothetical protein